MWNCPKYFLLNLGWNKIIYWNRLELCELWKGNEDVIIRVIYWILSNWLNQIKCHFCNWRNSIVCFITSFHGYWLAPNIWGFIVQWVEHCNDNVMGSNPSGARFFSSLCLVKFPLLLTFKLHEYLWGSHLNFRIVYYYWHNFHLHDYICWCSSQESLLGGVDVAIPIFHRYGHKASCQVSIYQFNSKWPCGNVKKCVAIPQHWLNTVVIIHIPYLPTNGWAVWDLKSDSSF